jgi:two-component system OmpR family sensor kinase
MSEGATDRPARTRAPISLQLVGLLLASLLVAQAISIGIILLMPPVRPPFYRVGEVAAAVHGGSLRSRYGRPMIRTVSRILPGELVAPRREHQATVAALARALGLPEARVRLEEQSASPMWRLRRALAGAAASRRDRGADMGVSPFEMDRSRRRFEGGPDMPIFGDFAVAAQGGDGLWTVVRSTPAPFPSTWQMEASAWLLGGFLLVGSAGYLFSRRISAPLRRFAEAAERLGRDPQAPQMTLKGPAEVGMAAQAFNEMQARLKRYINDRTAMVGAISHDLRTPLARIRFKLESAPAGVRQAVLSDVEQMEQMIDGVLAFIRDEGQPRRRERLDLLSLIECVADDAAMVGGQVEIAHGDPVTVDGDPVALQRLFSNLVDNAVKYGGDACIQVRREGPLAVVAIADRGPGLSPDELVRVFQPFYRTDVSRNLDNGGVGLGLPIARSTARAHGGDVELTSRAGGVTAIVTLPLAA